MSGGSLSQGFAVAAGMAFAAQLDGKKHKVAVLLGDGECEEGMVWETCLFIHKHQLSNLVVIVDKNRLQNDGFVKDIMPTDPLPEKFKAFGFDVLEIDGHKFEEILPAIEKAWKATIPTLIMAHTVKGKGISFMENDPQWHGKALSKEQLEKALKELQGAGA